MNPVIRDIAERLAAALPLTSEQVADGLTRPPRPDMGDWAFPCFPLAKEMRKAPAAIAAELAPAIEPGGAVAAVEAAGPYLNVRVDRGRLFDWLLGEIGGETDPWFGGEDASGKTMVIDYGSPNIAKHVALHHIRSHMIGHALVRIYRALGWNVVGINHLGDWGTTFGKLLVAVKRWGEGEDFRVDGVSKLNALYVRFGQEAKDDPSMEDEARDWFRRLEEGDEEAEGLWKMFREVSLEDFQGVYDMLGIRWEHITGESFYRDKVEGAEKRLVDAGLLEESDGAQVVKLEEEGMPPFLIRKRDGATLYATRDLAAAIYRQEAFRFDRLLYVTDQGQALHFRQLFTVLGKLGLDGWDRCRHVPFGVMRMGGKRTKTRTGEVVLLREVLERAVERIRTKIDDLNPELGPKEEVARQVGIGAIVFADLSVTRTKDVDFDWDRALDFEGHSGPYLQYAHARCCAVLRKWGREVPAEVDTAALTLDEEWGVARALEAFPARLREACEADEPSVVASALLDLAGAYSRWYNLGNRQRELRVLGQDETTTKARVALNAAVARTLRQGLWLLGLEAPEEM
jgi:arginyl-tRNA synthetase